MLKILKYENERQTNEQFEMFKSFPSRFCPTGLEVIEHPNRGGAQCLAYNFIDGRPPVSINDLSFVMQELTEHFWIKTGENVTTQKLEWYASHCMNIIDKLEGKDLKKYDADLCRTLVANLPELDLNEVKHVHGDLTIENILVDNKVKGRIVLIDPCSRSVPCREYDEGKLLQSMLTGWEHLKRGWNVGYPAYKSILDSSGTTFVHLIFLLTHWIRLADHPEKHSKKIIKTAKKEIIPSIAENIRIELEAVKMQGETYGS